MSSVSEQKRLREKACLAALDRGDFHEARAEAVEAARLGVLLAERSSGAVSEKQARDALGWIEIAEGLARARSSSRRGRVPEPAASRSAGGDGGDADDWLLAERPGTRFADVAGMADAKRSIWEMIVEPLRDPAKARMWGVRAGGGVLMYGPPGNGKTTLARAIAGELDAAFYYATGAQIRSRWHGESEQRLRRLLQDAKAQPVAILLLDDVDGLLPRRSGDSVVNNRIVAQFLAEVGGFEQSDNAFLLLGATNKPWEIDEAVFRTGRFDTKIMVGLPDSEARLFLLGKGLGEAPRGEGVDLAALARRLEGYTGSDVVGIAEAAKRRAFRRYLADENARIEAADFDAAFHEIPSSVTPALMKQYEAFRKARFG